jgi:hypothetical protein
VYSDG